MTRNAFFLLISIFTLTNCQNTTNDQAPAAKADSTSVAVKPKITAGNINEDDLMIRLSADLIAEPDSLADIDQNKIINYAIDHQLDIYGTQSGLYYRIDKEGEGEQLKWGDRVAAHYRAYTLDGKEFDNSYKKARPLKFYIGNMIPGFNEGLQLLKPRAKALFLIPSGLAYGDMGVQISEEEYLIPPNEVIVFEVEVLEKLKSAQ